MEIYSLLGRLFIIFFIIITGHVGNCEVQRSNCSKADLEALLDLKNGLHDPENRLSSWRGSNCCRWRGIGCSNRTGDITIIDLHNPNPLNSENSSSRYGLWNLSGDISHSLLKLNSLEYFDLSYNTFNDNPIPKFLGSLKTLRYLNLSRAGFSGLIPASLGKLSNLQVLDVSSQFFGVSASNLDWLTGLVLLEYLGMDGVDLSMVGPGWGGVLNQLSRLEELHLSNSGLSGSLVSSGLVNVTSLTVLDLSLNSFNSRFPGWVGNISSLVYVDLSNCGLYGRIPLSFHEFPNLKYLSLSGNANLSASCSQLLKGSWNKIEVLNLASNKLHGKLPDSLGNMTSLRNLDLSINNIEGGIPSSIGKLCWLENLYLFGNNLTGGMPQSLEGFQDCVSGSPLAGLRNLKLSSNRLLGTLPEWLGQLQNLVELDLSYNLLEGSVPVSLGQLQNITNLSLGKNRLNGTLPNGIGLLSQLYILDISSNRLTGVITEAHFSKTNKLKILDLSGNSFIINVSSTWIPPFQVQNLDVGSCHLGPSFPKWLSYEEEIQFLDMSNASISGFIPDWFWDISSNLSLLNVSFNQLQGQLPSPLKIAPYADVDFSSNLFEGPVPLPSAEIELFDLSNNQLSGSIPPTLAQSMPDLIFFSLASNNLTGAIPHFIGEMQLLQVIHLSRNQFTGCIPSSISNCSYLKVLDLAINNLSGRMPESLGQLSQLQSLHLSNNNLHGNIPPSFTNLSSLETLYLRNNNLSGNIPEWLGTGLSALRILDLSSNRFTGEIPSNLSNLSSLQILDLSQNNLTGEIPESLGDLKAMAQEQRIIQYLLYGKYRGLYYEESLAIDMKGQTPTFTKTLSLVTSIDLSGNNLAGDFPPAMTKLTGLVALNLSRSQLAGQVPENISVLQQLSSLDLSRNKLSGTIPSSLSSISFLGYLNLSENNFTGKIPYMGQLTTFDESSFVGNPDLCGAPLAIACNDQINPDVQEAGNGEVVGEWFYPSLGIGFGTGLLLPLLLASVRKSWADAYFGLVDSFVDKFVGYRT